jgi:hypothetical protein
MVREQLRLRSHHLRKTFVQHLHDPAMQLLPLTAQQRAVRCVLHQRMLEGVDRAALEDQPRNDETLQPTLHLCLTPLRNGSEEVIRELPPDGCADLCNLPRGGAEPAEPGHQRRVQAGGDRQSCQWKRRGGPLHVGLALRLQHRFRHFLHEQWDTVSALKNVLANACGQRLISNNAVDHPAGITLRQAVDVEACDERPSDPRRLELRPERHDQQHAQGSYPLHCSTKQFQAREESLRNVSAIRDISIDAGALGGSGFWRLMRCRLVLMEA